MSDMRTLRVGDAERDAAVSALGDHFAVGRITKDEYDERAGRAWSARFAADLDELFADLPQVRAQRPDPVRRRPRPRMLLTIPLAVLAVGALMFLIVSSAPWLLFILLMLFVFGGPGHRRRHWHGGGGPGPGWASSRS